MREANWDEIFQKQVKEQPASKSERSLLPWEDWLTFLIAAIAFMSVVHSIDSAGWVDEMPSLYPIGFSGLLIGYVLSKVRWPEALLHPIALFAGATLVFLQLLAIIPGGSAYVRTDALLDRMYAWWSAATQDGISTDPLPFIVMILTMLWLGAFVSSWAIFRWRNPWLALVPGGTALMWNISFIPGQFSYSFVVFIFAAVLLVMRVHLARKEEDWEARGVVYPEFLSLSVLHATFWVAVLLLAVVWLMPLSERSDTANERWSNLTAPIADRLTPLGRVFISVNAKKPIDVHNLKDALPLQGKIALNSRAALDVDVEITPEMASFLRAQSYDEYTSSGWKVNIEGDVNVPAGSSTEVEAPVEDTARKEVTVNITVKGNNDDFLYSLGQPVRATVASEAATGAASEDISGLTPRGRLRDGDAYSVTGSVAVASIEQLQAAGEDYPDWVVERYTSLPPTVPERVYRKAAEVTGSADTPYDKAAAIERYLRTFPNDFNVASTPPGRDSVDFFLFDAQRGYFDYYASAMAVMLRGLGVPARVATGYVVDPLTLSDDLRRFELTERNAFAWPEVYFPGIGWVEFSPTPTQDVIARPGTQPDRPEPAPPSEGGAAGQEDPIDLGINPGGGAATETGGGDGGGSGAWPVLLALAIAGAAVVLFGAVGRFAWEYGLGGLQRPAQVWEKTQRLARWGRAGGPPSETPREFASRLQRDLPGTDGAGDVAAAYERSAFGQKELTDDEAERLETAWASLRNTLLRRVLRLRPPSSD